MSASLDPSDWNSLRDTSTEALDHLLDHVRGVAERSVWRTIPPEVRARFRREIPGSGEPVSEIWEDIRESVLPYTLGNLHPRFFGWVHGAGTPVGIVAEMVAAAINANLGGRDHVPVLVERQVLRWCRELFALPEAAGGILTSGTSMANVIGLAAARQTGADWDLRAEGLWSASPLRVYTSRAAHVSVRKALELLGMGRASLAILSVDGAFRIRTDRLRERIAEDRREGLTPLCVVGSAGTVDTGAVDDLETLAEICREEDLWLHVDGAFGAAVRLSETHTHLLSGIERADSIAFDFHKWFHVPYDAGCVMVRDADHLGRAFSADASYLQRQERGAGGGAPWFADFGPELSRGFRALKVWVTWRAHGSRGLGAAVDQNLRDAARLGHLVEEDPDLELMAPVTLNIVCFRYRPTGVETSELDALNREIVVRLQERGIAVPSTADLPDGLAIRAAVVNHRTRPADVEDLHDAVRTVGREVSGGGS